MKLKNEDGKIRWSLVLILTLVLSLIAAVVVAGTVYVQAYRVDDDSIASCVVANSTSSQWTSIDIGGMFEITATGANVYILGAANPTATASANGHSTVIHEGTTRILRLSSAKIAHITSGGTGEICFLHREVR